MSESKLVEFKNNNINKLKELKGSGYKISVYHGRLFNNNSSSSKLILNQKEASELLNKGENLTLNNHGGFTLVEITSTDGRVFSGKESVKAGNQFNRKLGFHRAFSKAVKNLNK